MNFVIYFHPFRFIHNLFLSYNSIYHIPPTSFAVFHSPTPSFLERWFGSQYHSLIICKPCKLLPPSRVLLKLYSPLQLPQRNSSSFSQHALEAPREKTNILASVLLQSPKPMCLCPLPRKLFTCVRMWVYLHLSSA